jgi:hypothetical protein
MNITVRTAQKLLDRLSSTTGETQDFTGFRNMSTLLKGVQNENYLYKKVFLRIQGLKEHDEVGVSRGHMEIISKFLGYNNFRELDGDLNSTISKQLASLAGCYYCYVRANFEKGEVLRSPVRIYKNRSKMLFELKGPSMNYNGDVVAKKGCLFVSMYSQEGKVFHHVYKLGERNQPDVLQGTFTGISTAFDPIGGRCVLVRQGIEFTELTNKKIGTSKLKKSKVEEEKILGDYFDKYFNNNVAPKKSASFTLDDLR